MIITTKKEFRGRKSKIGHPCWDAGRMHFFVGYHECSDGKLGKVLVSIDEARAFANRVGYSKTKKRVELIRWLAKRYDI